MSSIVQVIPFKLKSEVKKAIDELNQFLKDLQIIEDAVIIDLNYVDNYALITCRREIKVEGIDVKSSISG